MITCDSNKHLKYLCAIMNSKLIQTLGMTLFTGLSQYGKYTYGSKDKMINIPIPIPQFENNQIENLVAKILKITSDEKYLNESLESKKQTLEKEIDKEVYKLYQLSKEEIKFIEKNSAQAKLNFLKGSSF